MKVSDTPRTGKIGTQVFYMSPYGVCCHTLVTPRDPRTQAQRQARVSLGISSYTFSHKLTDAQRQSWILAAQTVPTHPSLNAYSSMSGQQLCVKINSTLRCVSQPPTDVPPAPVVFSPNCVGDLTIGYDDAGNVQLLLAVGAAAEDIMLYAQAPCSAGRMKQRRVSYLSLLGPATNGQCDITAPYIARFGKPAPGQKVFVSTCQQKNGWKAPEHVTSAIVPPRPAAGEKPPTQAVKVQAEAAPKTPEAQAAAAQGISSLPRAMYKGSTPDAPGMHTGQPRVHLASILCASLVHSVRMAMAKLGALGMGAAVQNRQVCAN